MSIIINTDNREFYTDDVMSEECFKGMIDTIVKLLEQMNGYKASDYLQVFFADNESGYTSASIQSDMHISYADYAYLDMKLQEIGKEYLQVEFAVTIGETMFVKCEPTRPIKWSGR